MPAPASALGIFQAPLDPTAHAVPDGGRLCWLQIGDDQPHFLIAFIPTCQQGTLQATHLPRKTVDLTTPSSAYLRCCRAQTAKRAFAFWTKMALFVDAHERVPAQRHDLGR